MLRAPQERDRRPRPPILYLYLWTRELLGLRVELTEPDVSGPLPPAQQEDVQPLGDVALVDEPVVPVRRPCPPPMSQPTPSQNGFGMNTPGAISISGKGPS